MVLSPYSSKSRHRWQSKSTLHAEQTAYLSQAHFVLERLLEGSPSSSFDLTPPSATASQPG